MTRKEMALMLHSKKFNCAQSIVCSYCNVLGADPVHTFRQAEGFGLGMGSMSTCGCVTAAAMAVGLKMSDGDLDNPTTKRECYRMMSEITQEFEAKFGTTVCKELKDKQRDGGMVSCDELIASTIEILDRKLLGIEPGED